MSRREEIENTIKLLRRNGTEFDPPPVPFRISVEPKAALRRSSKPRKPSIKKSLKSRRSVRFSSKPHSFEPRNYSSESECCDDEAIHSVITTQVIVENSHDEAEMDRKIEIVDIVTNDGPNNMESKVEESDEEKIEALYSKTDEKLINEQVNSEEKLETEEIAPLEDMKSIPTAHLTDDLVSKGCIEESENQKKTDNDSQRSPAINFKISVLDDQRSKITSIKDDKTLGDFQTRKKAIQQTLEQMYSK